MEVRSYGWKPDPFDPHDRRLRFCNSQLQGQPPVASLLDRMPPVTNQFNLGACTGHAIAGLVGYRERTDGNPRLIVPSPLFAYYNARLVDGSTGYDAGATIRDTVEAVKRYGVCEEACWPYDVARFADRPPARCYDQAATWKVVDARRVSQAVPDLRACILAGDPVCFGFKVYTGFEKSVTARTGIVNLPGPDEYPLGGHAVLLVGYNDYEGRFTVRNSYGADWGQGGYFTMPYAYLVNPELADDFWCVGVIP